MVTERMICVYKFDEYFCLCGTFIFNSADVIYKSELNGRNYLFVPFDQSEGKLFGQHFAICSECRHRVGNWIYKDGIRYCVRFHKHLIIEKPYGIFLHQERSTIHELE